MEMRAEPSECGRVACRRGASACGRDSGGPSSSAACCVLGLPLLLLRACRRPTIQSTLKAPPTPAQMAELWVEPERNRDLFWGVGGQRARARSRGDLHRHRDEARRVQPRLHRQGPARTASGAPSSHLKRRPKWRVANPVGHRLPSAAGLLPARVAGRQGRLAEPAAARPLPRAARRPSTGSTPTAPGRTTATPSSARAS